jgi:hypothetical protein
LNDLLERALQRTVIGIRADVLGGIEEALRLRWIVGFWDWFARHCKEPSI